MSKDPKAAAAGLSEAFFARLASLGKRHATDPDVYLVAWNMESALDPRAINPSSGARGLNQMMPSTLRGLHAPADFEQLAGEEQIPWIEKLITSGEALNGGPFKTAARYYHSNFFPRTMKRGSAPSAVVVAKGSADPDEVRAYHANASLDLDHDGRVTVADLTAWLNSGRSSLRYGAARARLELAMRASLRGKGVARAAPGVLLGAGVLAAAVAWRVR